MNRTKIVYQTRPIGGVWQTTPNTTTLLISFFKKIGIKTFLLFISHYSLFILQHLFLSVFKFKKKKITTKYKTKLFYFSIQFFYFSILIIKLIFLPHHL